MKGADMIGLVVFSFGLRAPSQEPNPSNIALGNEVDHIIHQIHDHEVKIVAQWEVALQLEALGIDPTEIIGLKDDGSYLSSKDVWNAARQYFKMKGITLVIPVAQPFLHLAAVEKMIRADGFKILKYHVHHIVFDNDISNTQPWTRSKFSLLLYALKVKFGGMNGHRGRQSA